MTQIKGQLVNLSRICMAKILINLKKKKIEYLNFVTKSRQTRTSELAANFTTLACCLADSIRERALLLVWEIPQPK